ncbi:hypothetical protein B0H15DRAFT_888282 [Mycena belliarum]|uniref:Uncharacterized protein n=1 Tax=Mycena belliarum TaxID=1033014 RepID=A0AAD6XMF7_9AGAR|nr:hypothetical protein B0H15DRAFT_888282 [Mycena belliae]
MSPSSTSKSAAGPGPTPKPDVDSKIRLYGAFAALRRSRMPTNAQFADALEYVKANPPVDEKKLSPEGRKLVGDIRDILTSFSTLVQDKNKDEILQRFVWATRGVDTSTMAPTDGHKEKGNQELDKAKRDAQQAAHHLRTLLSIVLTNGEMRKLLTDAGTVGRDLLSKGAAKAAEAVAPHPDQLQRADDPAPQDHFHDDDPLSKMKSTKQTIEPSASASSISDDSADDTDSDEPTSPNANPTKEEKAKGGKKTLLGRIHNLRQSKKPMIDDAQAWLSDEFFPEERRAQWVWRGKKVIIECQKHGDYQESMRWLLDTIDAWAVRARDVKGDESVLPASTLAQDPALRTALGLLRTLLERVANAPLAPLFKAARVLATDAQSDPELRKWWQGVDAYVRKVLLHVGYVTEPACGTRAKELRQSGRMFYREKYRSHFDAVFDALSGWFKSFADDPLNQAVGEDVARLTKDLLFDGEGNLQFKKTLWEDVRGVILPALVDKVGYIPIPRVEYTDDAFDVVVENLTLSGRHLFPNVVEIEAHNLVRFSPYAAKAAGDASTHEFTFTFSEVHADMRDVAFSFRTKTGPIKMRDSGLADVVLGGSGLEATVTLTSSKDTRRVFNVSRVRVKVGSLKFRIRDSKHDLLYKTLKPLATRLIKKQIKKALEDSIRTGFEYVDGQLLGVRERMAEAQGPDGKGVGLSEIFKKKEKDTASVAAGSTASSGSASQFKVSASKSEALMPDRGHPAGWVNRTAGAEAAEAADEGAEQWRSDAFDLGAPIKGASAVAPGKGAGAGGPAGAAGAAPANHKGVGAGVAPVAPAKV